MKVVRVIANILIGIIMFVLILGLSIVITTKSFIEKDLLLGLVKASISETLAEENNIVENKDKILDEIFLDKTTEDVARIILDNYKKYQEDRKNFTVSDSDVEIITSFALKHKDKIKEFQTNNDEVMTDEKIKEILSKENINQLSNRVYEEINNGLGEEVNETFDIYEKVTNKSAIVIISSIILLLIIILGLINWSLYKWMIVPGVCLIISGIIVFLMYILCLFLNEIISSSGWFSETIGNINFIIYLIVSGIEIIVGIILIIVYSSLKNKPFNDQINNLGVGE